MTMNQSRSYGAKTPIAVCFSSYSLPIELKAFLDALPGSANGHPLSPVTSTKYSGDIFNPARAANALIREACSQGACDVIVKTDVDCRFTDAFWIAIERVKEGFAIAPIIGFYDRNRNVCIRRTGPSGTVAMHKADWMSLYGYDERMSGHGHEDGAFLDRARNHKIIIERTEGNLVTHTWHPRRISPWYPRRRKENIRITQAIEQGKMCEWNNQEWGL